MNIAEILKDCPKGMELDCILFKDTPIYFDKVANDTSYPIEIKVKYPNEELETFFLNKFGCIYDRNNAKCVIFPKGKTTWEGFQRPFKDGDIIYTRDEYSDATFTYVAILKQIEKGEKINSHCFYNYEDDYFSTHDFLYDGYNTRLATEEEKELLFNAIKDNGYRWNAETKTLEELIGPKFKVGDWIEFKYYERKPEKVIRIENNVYWLSSGRTIMFQDESAWDLATKFDLSTLKPFESRVLMRESNSDYWRPTLYGCRNEVNDRFCAIIGGTYRQCIPYKSNEYLLGTTNDCDDFYKTWE